MVKIKPGRSGKFRRLGKSKRLGGSKDQKVCKVRAGSESLVGSGGQESLESPGGTEGQ